MKPIELFELLDQLKIYSNCDDLRFTYDGNVMEVWFYWMDKDFNVRLQFSKIEIERNRAFETTDLMITFIMEFVNMAKREWSLKHGTEFEEPTDGGDELNLGNISV